MAGFVFGDALTAGLFEGFGGGPEVRDRGEFDAAFGLEGLEGESRADMVGGEVFAETGDVGDGRVVVLGKEPYGISQVDALGRAQKVEGCEGKSGIVGEIGLFLGHKVHFTQERVTIVELAGDADRCSSWQGIMGRNPIPQSRGKTL